MNSFNEIIKEKVDKFEVPFNEAHWADMESRLNQVSSNKSKNILLGSAAAAVAVLVLSYFLFAPTSPEVNKSESKTPKEVIVKEINKPVLPEASPTAVKIEQEPAIKNITEAKELPASLKEQKKTTFKVPVGEEKREEAAKEPSKAVLKPSEISTLEVVRSEEATKEKAAATSIVEEKSFVEETDVIEEKAPEAKEETAASTAKMKNIHHKAYEDENLTKKSVRRRRMPSFFSFKKRIYKVPLAKKKSKKRKK